MAVIQDTNIICHKLNFRQKVRRHQDRTVKALRQGFNERADFVDAYRIQTIGGFI